jgi:hypothetical protein
MKEEQTACCNAKAKRCVIPLSYRGKITGLVFPVYRKADTGYRSDAVLNITITWR